MTRAAVQGYISRATALLNSGDCDAAGQTINEGYSALQDYARVLAAHRASPAPTLKLQKALAKVYARQQTSCVTDSLIAPSFSGVPELVGGYSKAMPFVGFALATIGLVVGIGALYKEWG